MRRILALLLAAPLLLGACGTDDDSPDAVDGVTVDHRFGSTTVPADPERIVTIDLQWTDVVLGLGVEPVGYTADPLMPDGQAPWQELGSATALSTADGIPFEDVVELDPDLILVNFSATDQATYDKLSAIAPTVPDLDEAQVGNWEDMVEVAGEILGREDEADALIASVDEQVTAIADDLPGLEDKTFVLAQYVVGDQLIAVADTADGSSQFFQDLGMTLFEPVRALGEETGEARVQVSQERSDLLEADLLAFLINGGDESDLSDIPGFDELPGTVAVLQYPEIVGLNTPTPLSIPYALEKLRPFLDEAAAA